MSPSYNNVANDLPRGVVRGPDGTFVSTDDVSTDDFEYVHATARVTPDPADYTGSILDINYADQAEWEGLEVIDMEELVDRHEVARLVAVDGMASLGIPAGNTADNPGAFRAWAELSASPDIKTPTIEALASPGGDLDLEDSDSIGTVIGDVESDDTADIIASPIVLQGSTAESDETNGVGTATTNDSTEIAGPLPGEWVFDRRDELFLNGMHEVSGLVANSISVELAICLSLAFTIEEQR